MPSRWPAPAFRPVFMIFLVIIIVFFILIIITKFKAKHDIGQVVNFFDGTIGAGKTLLAVLKIKFDYLKAKLLYNLHLIKCKPRIYSNIPLYIGKNDDIYVLKRDHLLLKEQFPDDICPFVLLDELSMIASCYGWDDPNFTSRNLNENMETLDTFIRFFRHFYGRNNNDRLRMYMTDQATGSVNIQIRRRLGYVDYLYKRHRFMFITPYFIIPTKEMVVEEDTVNTNNVDLPDKDRQYFMIYVGYRWMRKLLHQRPYYDSHCFDAALKSHNFVNSLPYDIWPKDSLTTNYCPDLRMTDVERKEFKELAKKLNLGVSYYGPSK